MKYLLIGNSNAARAQDQFITQDHALRKERRFIRCTSAMAFKLQVCDVSLTWITYNCLTIYKYLLNYYMFS